MARMKTKKDESDRLASQGANAEAMLVSYVNRIERLNEEKVALAGDIADIFTEVKSAGFDTKIVREILRERKMDAATRAERDMLLATYRKALGMLADTPLGAASMVELAAGLGAAAGVAGTIKAIRESRAA